MVLEVKYLEDIANIDYGTRVVKSKVKGDEYPVYGGGGETFRINKYNRENCVVISRFAMSPKCTRHVNEKIFLNDSGLTVSTKDNSKLLQEYLDWYILSKNNEIYSLGRGAGQRNLEIPSFKRMLISYPANLEEQQKIISRLKLADEIRTKKRIANDKLDEYLKSTFVDMFGDPVKNPKKHRETTIGEVCYFVKDGPHKSPNYQETGIPFISVNNIISGKWNFDNIKYISKEDHETFRKRCHAERGDVLYTKGGTTGFAKYVDIDLDFSNWVHVAVLKFDKNIMNGRFFESMLNSDYCYKQSQQYTRGIANRDLVLGQMKKIRLYLPTIEEQNKFAKIVEKVETQKQKNEQVIEQMDNLFNSLSQRAFKGELTKSNVVDLLTRQVALHSKIIDKCNSHQTFGAVKLEKIFNLCDMIQDLNLVPGGYYRKAAGPYVPEMRHTVEQELLQNNWVKITNQGNGKKVEYKKDSNFTAYKAIYNQIFNDKNQEIENIINYFYDKDTNYCEAFSTLYMCWNDLILEGEKPTKTEIIDEFKNHWAPEKQRFERIYLLEILSDMSNQGFEPQGHGVHTIESNYNHNKDQLSLQLK